MGQRVGSASGAASRARRSGVRWQQQPLSIRWGRGPRATRGGRRGEGGKERVTGGGRRATRIKERGHTRWLSARVGGCKSSVQCMLLSATAAMQGACCLACTRPPTLLYSTARHPSPSLPTAHIDTAHYIALHRSGSCALGFTVKSIPALIAVYSCCHYMSSSPSPSCCLPPIRLLCFWPWPSSLHVSCKNPVLAPPSSVAGLTHHLNVVLATRNQCL
jgi:hypothetical protein